MTIAQHAVGLKLNPGYLHHVAAKLRERGRAHSENGRWYAEAFAA
jgi:hypothetical protein